MHQPPCHSVTWCALTAAATTPPAEIVGGNDPAGQDRAFTVGSLADDLKTELVQASERRQVGATEDIARQANRVAVSWSVSVTHDYGVRMIRPNTLPASIRRCASAA
jgi:hypothetical protein